MSNPKKLSLKTNLEEILKAADESLSSIDPYPYSPKAFILTKSIIHQFIIQLVAESLKIAKRHGSDTISEDYVKTASQYLNFKSSTLIRNLGTLGGILFGVSFSSLLSTAKNNNLNAKIIVIAFVLVIIGAILMTIQFIKDK